MDGKSIEGCQIVPLPKPSDIETDSEFISRCMSDEIMIDDFPEEDQRLAVCNAQWDESRATYKGEEIDLVPTESMAEEAQRGLDWRKEFGRGGTEVGVARARQLINRQELSPRTIRRMYSFKERHMVDRDAEGWSPGEEGYPSAGRIAAALWGLPAGDGWVDSKRNQLEKIDERSLNVEERQMAVVLNKPGLTNARSLIDQGSVDVESDWEFSADDGDKILGDPPNWDTYAEHHLGINSSSNDETKDAYSYPFAKDGTVYRSALAAIRQRAGQQDETQIFNAAGELLDMIDDKQRERNLATPDVKTKPAETETRNFVVDEIRVVQDGKKRRIVGHAAVFNKDSEFMGFTERVAPGAFRSAINNDDVRALINHDPNFVLGRNRAGTLKMYEDDIGLHVEIDPPETQYAKDLLTVMDRGDVSQMSFGFVTKTDEWDYSGDWPVRTLKDVELFDVSIVTYPAYPDTSAAVRSMDKWKEKQQVEEQKTFDTIDLKRKELDLISK